MALTECQTSSERPDPRSCSLHQAGGGSAAQATGAAASPAQSPARTHSQDVCFKCQQPGHWSRDCPGVGAGRPAADAGRRDSGVFAAGAGSPPPEPSTPPAYRSQDVCFKCQQPGHWSRDCPGMGGGRPAEDYGRRDSGVFAAGAGSPPEPSPLPAYRSQDVCFKCQQPGHWSRDCPGVGGGRLAADAGRRDSGVFAAGAGSPPEPSPLNAYRSQDVCFKCQQPGHWSRDCPGIRARAAADDDHRASGGVRGGVPMPGGGRAGW